MDTFFVLKNGKQIGPYPVDEIKTKLRESEIGFDDLCWSEGMPDWKTIRDTIDLGDMPIPPKAPAGTPPPPPPETTSPNTGDLKAPVMLAPALFASCAGLIGAIIFEVLWYSGADEIAGVLALFFVPILLVSTVLCAVLHYKCWKAIPEAFRSTTPARAVGFMFIPIFNFYWAFISYPGLAHGLRSSGYDVSKGTVLIANAYAVLFVLCYTVGWFPVIGWILTIPYFILFILLYVNATRAINQKFEAQRG